jgi:hypothetical protein
MTLNASSGCSASGFEPPAVDSQGGDDQQSDHLLDVGMTPTYFLPCTAVPSPVSGDPNIDVRV